MSTAKEIMTTQIYTVTADESLGTVAQNLVEKGYSGAMVIDEGGRLMGIMTEKDILVAYDFLEELDTKIRDFISRDVITVKESDPISEVTTILIHRNIKRVPVVGDNMKLVGVISRRDVLKHVIEKINANQGG